MKKAFLFLSSLILTTAIVHAAGFIGKIPATTAAEAVKLPDDSYVTIRGNILKKLSSDKYTFKDSSGTITVEIDSDKWGNIEANEKDILELSGEIERKPNSVYLDVDTVKKVINK